MINKFRFYKIKKTNKKNSIFFTNIKDYIKKKYTNFLIKKQLVHQYKYKVIGHQFYTQQVRFFWFFAKKAVAALKSNKKYYFFLLSKDFYFKTTSSFLHHLEFSFNFGAFLVKKIKEISHLSQKAQESFNMFLKKKKLTLLGLSFIKKYFSNNQSIEEDEDNTELFLEYSKLEEKILSTSLFLQHPKNKNKKNFRTYTHLKKKLATLHNKLNTWQLTDNSIYITNIFLMKLVGINQRHGLRKKMITNIFLGLSHFKQKHNIKKMSNIYILSLVLAKLDPKYKLGKYNISRRKSILIPHILTPFQTLINKAKLLSKAIKKRKEKTFAIKFSNELTDIFLNKSLTQKMQKDLFKLVYKNKNNAKYSYTIPEKKPKKKN